MNEHRRIPMPTTPELVAQGIKLYAAAESALRTAEEALIELAGVYYSAYANGDLAGGDAIKARTSILSLAGDLASIHAEVITCHERDTAFAQAAEADIAAPYAELPPRTGPAPRDTGR